MAENPTLVFTHGMFCTGDFFNNLIEFFTQKGYQCKKITLPYHDTLLKEKPDIRLANYGISEYSDFLYQELAKIKGDYILVGHSMGGLITLKTAAHPLVNPKKVILLSPAAPWGVFALKPSVFKTFFSVLMTKNFQEIPISLSFEDISFSMLNKIPEDKRHAIYEKMVWESGKAAFEMGFWVFDSHRASHVDPSYLNCPIIVFTGDSDNITPYSVVKKATIKLEKSLRKISSISRVKLITLFDTGHWLLTELSPEKILEEIERE